MRRRLTLLMTVVLMFGLMAAPAAADQPAVFSFPDGFTGVDPCTGNDHEGTLHVTVTIHEDHDGEGTVLGRVDLAGTTDSGYVLIDNDFRFTAYADGVYRDRFEEIWHNEGTGDMYRYSGDTLVTADGAETANVEQRCLSGPTFGT